MSNSNVNIVATRIDQRLLHGQATMFVKKLNTNTVVVCNDEASKDKMQQSLMKVCLSNDIALRFFSTQHTIEVIGKASPQQKIILIIGNVVDAYKLVKGGVPIKEVNIGNIHATADRKKYNRFINLNEDELKMLKELKKDFGVKFSNNGLSTDVTDQPLNWDNILS